MAHPVILFFAVQNGIEELERLDVEMRSGPTSPPWWMDAVVDKTNETLDALEVGEGLLQESQKNAENLRSA